MTEQNRRPTRRAGAGRKARTEKRLAGGIAQAIWPGMQGGQYRPLSDTDMKRIHDGALEILVTTGIGEPLPELLDIVLPLGCSMNEYGRLCFPKVMIEDIIAGAAREYTVYARGSRQGQGDIYCNGNRVYFSNSGSAVTTFDSDNKRYRASTMLDMYDFTRLVDRLDNIHMCGDTVVGTDVPNDYEHDMSMVYALLAGTEKPLCLSFRSRGNIGPAMELFDFASGGEGAFLKKPSVIFGGCPIVSPLRFGRENLEVMIDAARLGLVSDIAVAPQSGATAPATLAGTLAQVVAETLSCLAIVNLIRPGCPVTFATWPFITDLRTGSFSGGSGEQAVLAAAAIQMGNYYDLPNSVGAGMTDAKIPDAQYGYEKGLTIGLAALSGANRVCEVGGMMGSLMGCSFESMVIDNEAVGMIQRVVRGIEVSDETLSIETIHHCAVDPGHFLGNPQTLNVMESEYVYPELMDRSPSAQWEAEGSQDLFERSKKVSREILCDHYPNYFGRQADVAIRERFPIKISSDDMRPDNGRWRA
ncbi:MAG: trimethylamine methyltransferase family protein [Arenicellales bacterium]|nr:trimethylamine methyltransferase family protein [Arenicellales bacterium]